MLISLQEFQKNHLSAYSIQVLYVWVRDGVIPSVRVGRKILVDPVDVIAALKGRAAGSVQ